MKRSDLRRAADRALERASGAVSLVQHFALLAAETGDLRYVEVARRHLRYARFDYERWRVLNARLNAN